MSNLTYVVITPARNEADSIERTLQSMTAQTVAPLRWVVVSDASTDGTDDLVRGYAERFDWIRLLRLEGEANRNFGAKVRAFKAGYDLVKDLAFDVIANVDADVSFEPDLFAFLLDRFAEASDLGVAGVPMVERGHDAVNDGLFNPEDVFGACQLFRRQCYLDTGGYQAIPCGGIDFVAVRTARMRGWRTQSFLEKRFHHHHVMGAAGTSVLGARYKYGLRDYYFGNDPLWQVFRTAYQFTRKPVGLGGLWLLAGYLSGVVKRLERPVSAEFIAFHRQDQRRRLWRVLRKLAGIRESEGKKA
ncbi:MAG: glycosyltransferase [Candidatus Hydrogenedentes bacterium]|nr:glycosyltransferase [Candidatus Hydrogenedentota bacterium]